MLRTIITPSMPTISIPIPQSYIGKQVEVTFSLVDRIEEKEKPKQEQKLSDMFRGVFSKEDAESFIAHTKTMREEWNDI